MITLPKFRPGRLKFGFFSAFQASNRNCRLVDSCTAISFAARSQCLPSRALRHRFGGPSRRQRAPVGQKLRCLDRYSAGGATPHWSRRHRKHFHPAGLLPRRLRLQHDYQRAAAPARTASGTGWSAQGRCSVNVLPRPGTLVTVRCPFIASAMVFASGKPRPVPRICAAVTEGLR